MIVEIGVRLGRELASTTSSTPGQSTLGRSRNRRKGSSVRLHPEVGGEPKRPDTTTATADRGDATRRRNRDTPGPRRNRRDPLARQRLDPAQPITHAHARPDRPLQGQAAASGMLLLKLLCQASQPLVGDGIIGLAPQAGPGDDRAECHQQLEPVRSTGPEDVPAPWTLGPGSAGMPASSSEPSSRGTLTPAPARRRDRPQRGLRLLDGLPDGVGVGDVCRHVAELHTRGGSFARGSPQDPGRRPRPRAVPTERDGTPNPAPGQARTPRRSPCPRRSRAGRRPDPRTRGAHLLGMGSKRSTGSRRHPAAS